MKKLIIKSALFILMLLPVVICLEYRLSHVANSYNTKLNLFKNNKDCEVLVLGSSHALHGINPVFFGHKGFNMASTSQGLYHDKEIFIRHAPSLQKLKYVIVNVSYFSLEADMESGPEYWRTFFYYHFYGIPPQRWLLRWDIRNFSMLALYGPQSVKYLKSLPGELRGNVTETGWCPLGVFPGAISDEHGKARMKFFHKFMREDYRSENIRYMREIIEPCLRGGITPVLLTTPVSRTCSTYIDEVKFSWWRECIERLCAEYKLRHLNYFTDSRFSFEDFSDNDHLNGEGAEKLSKIIDAEIFQNAESMRLVD